MSSLFRGEDMTLCQIYFQSEAAYSCIAQLGELGIVQFRDVRILGLKVKVKVAWGQGPLFLVLAEPERECFSKKVRQRGETMRGDGEKAAVPRDRDPEGEGHPAGGAPGVLRGAQAERDDRP